jgi:RNA polymerase sigma-70 factor (ECF subfamily)
MIVLARTGSEDAVRTLFQRFWPLAWQWAYAVVGDRMLADQAAQEAIVKAFRTLDRFDPERPFGPWLKRIVVNRAIDELRHERRRMAVQEWEEMRAPIGVDENAGALATAFDAVRALPRSQRTAIVLHYWLDLGVDDIAQLLNVPVGTIVSRLSRARATLRERMEEHHGV